MLPELDKEADNTWVGDFYGSMLHEDTEEARPALIYHETPDELEGLFDTITYGKSEF